jgi:hypothetical protein
MNSKRANELLKLMRYDNGGCLNVNAVRPEVDPITDAERDLLRKVWGTMPGSSTMFDVVNGIASGRILVTTAMPRSEYAAAIAELEAVADEAEQQVAAMEAKPS